MHESNEDEREQLSIQIVQFNVGTAVNVNISLNTLAARLVL